MIIKKIQKSSHNQRNIGKLGGVTIYFKKVRGGVRDS